MDSLYELGYRTGLAFGCASQGTTAAQLKKSATCVKACLQDESVQAILTKLASLIFSEAGEGFEKQAAVYEVMSNRPGARSKYVVDTYIAPVLDTLAACSMQKQAKVPFGLSDIISGAAGAAGAAQDFVYKSALLSAIGGAGLSALGWHLFRDMKEDDASALAKHEQAKMYRRIAKDLQKRIDAQEDSDPDRKKLRKTLEEEGAGDYVL